MYVSQGCVCKSLLRQPRRYIVMCMYIYRPGGRGGARSETSLARARGNDRIYLHCTDGWSMCMPREGRKKEGMKERRNADGHVTSKAGGRAGGLATNVQASKQARVSPSCFFCFCFLFLFFILFFPFRAFPRGSRNKQRMICMYSLVPICIL